jgi:hypothetical protein
VNHKCRLALVPNLPGLNAASLPRNNWINAFARSFGFSRGERRFSVKEKNRRPGLPESVIFT